MSTHDLFLLLALIAFGAATVVAAIQKTWVAALFCAGVFCLALSGSGLIAR